VATSKREPRSVVVISVPYKFYRCEAGELAPRRSIQWLYPQIVNAFFPHRIENSLTGGHERQTGEGAGIKFEGRFFSIQKRIQDEHNRVIRFACFECGDSLAVGRKVIRLGGRLDNCFGRAAVDGNALEKMIFSGVDEVQPFAVM